MKPLRCFTIQAVITMLHVCHVARSLSLSSSFTVPNKFRLVQGQKITVREFRRSIPTMMPEGPEVRTLTNQLQPGIGKRLVNMQFVSGRYTTKGRPRGYEEFRKTMTSYVADDTTDIDIVTDWNCKGKFIWLSLDKGSMNHADVDNSDYHRSIWITLGMSGRFVRDTFNAEVEDDGSTHKQPRWYFEFLDESTTNPDKATKQIFYYDTRNFGTLRFCLSKKELTDKLKSLGPDILEDINEHQFMEILRKQRQSMNICKFLMNQAKISGVGNYLLSEALYRAILDPFASLDEISDEQALDLYKEVVDTARASYEAQVSRRGGYYNEVEGNEGQYAFALQCYGREYCPKGNEIIRETDGPHGRTIWYVEDQLFMPRLEREAVEISQEINVNSKRPRKESVEYRFVQREDANLALPEALQEESWKEELAPFLGSEKFDRLTRFVASERRLHTVFPLTQDVFATFNMCPFDKVKVVIIGQDPYHGPGQGHGLAFSVQKGVKLPPSLKNIFKELEADVSVDVPMHGNLEKWANQGVLLLNTVSTVRQGEANSHSKMGWEDFSDEVVEILNEKKEGLVFLLWGAPAAKKGKAVDKSKHTVITTSHPSPLGATKTSAPFLVSKHDAVLLFLCAIRFALTIIMSSDLDLLFVRIGE